MSQKGTENGPPAPSTGTCERPSAGRATEFENLYWKYSSLVRSVATRLCRNASDRDDLVSEFWLRVLTRCQSEGLAHWSNPNYLLTVLSNLHLNQLRSWSQRSKLSDLSIVLALHPASEPEPAYGALGDKLLQLVDQLPPDDRLLLLEDRRKAPGTRPLDAAEANRLRVKRHRLRHKLREELQSRESALKLDGVSATSPMATEPPPPGIRLLGAPRKETSDES